MSGADEAARGTDAADADSDADSDDDGLVDGDEVCRFVVGPGGSLVVVSHCTDPRDADSDDDGIDDGLEIFLERTDPLHRHGG